MLVEKNTSYGYMSYYENDMVFADTLKNDRIYEQELVLLNLTDIIKSSKTILDIGAHAGSHTILYKYLNPDCDIYAFEPQSMMFDLLKHNIKKNSLSNIKVFNKAVANIEIKSNMNNVVSDGDNVGSQIEYGTNKRFNLGGLQIGGSGEEIETITIDSLNLNSCDYMKIDVEGFEPLVLIGAEQTIKKFKPTILFESNHKTISSDVLKKFNIEYPIKNSFSILKEYGYSNIKMVQNKDNYLAIY